jgi:hypothetical protein
MQLGMASSGVAAQQANVPDATSLAFIEIDFGTVRPFYGWGMVGAGNLRGVGRLSATVCNYIMPGQIFAQERR